MQAAYMIADGGFLKEELVGFMDGSFFYQKVGFSRS
jgi:hypothetical protein